MLISFLADVWRRLVAQKAPVEQDQVQVQPSLEKGFELWSSGDVHAAMLAYQDALAQAPQNVELLTNLGVCYAALGDERRASELFERAYLLDDTYLPGVINHARVLVDVRKSADALPFLRHVWCSNPSIGTLYSVYSALCLNLGNVKAAVHFQLKGWLSDFDVLRSANGFLFKSSYADIDEATVASEHVFWAETLRQIRIVEVERQCPKRTEGRVRIGYWSPDLRNHSVRYFFRPLIEGHDKSKFETFVYHDNHAEDAQTDLIRNASEHFYNVYELDDQSLYDLISSHGLDILVELAGHTSANRLPLLDSRMATLQVSGIGYPPTTGLRSVDLKVIDQYVCTPDAAKFYAEEPLVLPHSFWCFDPMEEAVIEPVPPVARNGYVTYACVGNLAKINKRMVSCWRQILERVDSARLVLRSISFEDTEAFASAKALLSQGGVPLDRVDLLLPAGGQDFFRSYADIDVVLDTYPFNGGTTTCFATYMGAPVVSLYGQSLTSRMGLSILSNLGFPDLAVDNETDYVERAVSLGQDVAFLRSFRETVRQSFQQSSLGNGQRYAREFEEACTQALSRHEGRAQAYEHQVAPLPEAEVMKRAYQVMAVGNLDAARRMLSYCVQHHPRSVHAQLLSAQIEAVDNGPQGAISVLEAAVGKFAAQDQVSLLISLVHWTLQASRLDDAQQYLGRLNRLEIHDLFDRLQVQLFDKALSPDPCVSSRLGLRKSEGAVSVTVVVPVDEMEVFDAIKVSILDRCPPPPDWTVRFIRCSPNQRHRAYADALMCNDEMLIVWQSGVEIHAVDFFQQVWAALQTADVVSFAGALRWPHLDWRQDEFAYKVAGFAVPTHQQGGAYEVRFLGCDRTQLVQGVTVLDGALLAMKPRSVRHVPFDEELMGAEWLLEEEWAFRVGQQGGQLAVHRSLGVLLATQNDSDVSLRGPARMRWIEKYNVEAFALHAEDHMFVSVLTPDPIKACAVLRSFTDEA